MPAGVGDGTRATDATGRPLDQIPDIGAHERAGTNDVIYYVDDNDHVDNGDRILRVGADLANPQVVVGGRPDLVDVAVDMTNGRIYWLQDDGDTLGSSALDGSDIAPLISTAAGSGATAIAVDEAGGHLLVAFEDPLEIRRYELGNIVYNGEVVVDSPLALGGVVDIVVTGGGTLDDPKRVFWADAGDGDAGVDQAIRSALVEGTNADVRTEVSAAAIGAGTFEALAVSADGNEIYWTDPRQDYLGSAVIDEGLVYTQVRCSPTPTRAPSRSRRAAIASSGRRTSATT